MFLINTPAVSDASGASTFPVADHAPADLPYVPDDVIDALDLVSIANLCGKMADLPRDRWTGLVTNPAEFLPVASPS